jgi:two-component sensor histidine kinase
MEENKKIKKSISRLGLIFLITSLFWSILIISLGVWNYNQHISSVHSIIKAVAINNFKKDLLYREWATFHGGVYVPETSSTPPNKYLSDIPERDIVTPSGKKLTLMNPAYMIRQIYELGMKNYSYKDHITSLNPLRPENIPDDWERKSLLAFEKGEKETETFSLLGGQEYFRFMRPLFTAKGCLRCHARQGYKEGDIRGGISVSIPWNPFQEANKLQRNVIIAIYIGIWLIGFVSIILVIKLIRKYLSERKKSEEKISSLLNEKELILKEVHHRIKNNMNSIKGLLHLHENSIDDKVTISALKDAGRRIESMMVLYDKLYRSENFKVISLKNYIPSLAEEIISHFPNSASVKIETKIDDFTLDISKLQALGIIINELLTNMMKYAFVGREQGLISISAFLKESRVTIEIQDNGVGMPETIDFKSSKGFGMQLVSMLTEQIRGRIRIERGGGTKFILEFSQ